ncbi:hypothetical protein M427DRAFT_34289 [Gonapodya prolifera JEL478]|uniref:Uncharacterized protein n=1 Tax=Gonapodya prolifera (strain JEL478) TaxID=1344416 RepID=A0A139A8C7_GONPJ|nr:hypothetical protein M427DRAFT_34289 [Gonapodya prolifera JEL478]|eukprot:KXS13052.1 hypothetical protein M427DRAFT_34289 [Gonapodya prolifera JEL478]
MDPSYTAFLDNARIRIAVVPVHPLSQSTYTRICGILRSQFECIALQDLPVSAATEAQGRAAAAGAVGGGSVNFNFTTHLAASAPLNAYVYIHFVTPSSVNSLQHSTGTRVVPAIAASAQPSSAYPSNAPSSPPGFALPLPSQSALASAAVASASLSTPDAPILIDGQTQITGSRYEDFAASRQILGVVGIASCVDSPDLPAAAAAFRKAMFKYPTALSSRLLAFDPLPTTPDSTRGVVLIPSEGRPPEFYLATIIADMVAEVIAAFGVVASNWERRKEVHGPRGCAVLGSLAGGGAAAGPGGAAGTAGAAALTWPGAPSMATPSSPQGPTYPSLDHNATSATYPPPPRTPTLTPFPSTLLINGLPASALGQQAAAVQVQASTIAASAAGSYATSGAGITALPPPGTARPGVPSPLGRSILTDDSEKSMEDINVGSVSGGLDTVGGSPNQPVGNASPQPDRATVTSLPPPTSPPPLDRPLPATPPSPVPVRAAAPSPPPHAITSPPTSPIGEMAPDLLPFISPTPYLPQPNNSTSYAYPPPSPVPAPHSPAPHHATHTSASSAAYTKLARRRAPARFQKLLGDLLLLSGRTVEAMQTYAAAVEGCRQGGDAVWAAGAQEGYLASVMVAAAARVGVGMYTMNSRYAMPSSSSLDLLSSSTPTRPPATTPTPPESTPLRTLVGDLPDRYREIVALYEKVVAQPPPVYFVPGGGPGGGGGGGFSSVAGMLGLSGMTMGLSSVFDRTGSPSVTDGSVGPPPPLAARTGTSLSIAGQPSNLSIDPGAGGLSAPGTAVVGTNGSAGSPIAGLPQHPLLICNVTLRVARFLAALHRARTPVVFTNAAGYYTPGGGFTEKITGGLVTTGADGPPPADTAGVTKADVSSWLAKCWSVASTAERFGSMTTAEKTIVAGYIASVYGYLGMVRKEAFFLRIAAEGAATCGGGGIEGSAAWARHLDMGKSWDEGVGSNESLVKLEERALRFSRRSGMADGSVEANDVEAPGLLECFNRILDVLGGGAESNAVGLLSSESPGGTPSSSPPSVRKRTPTFLAPTPEDNVTDYGYLNDPMTEGDLLNEKLHPFILTAQIEAGGVYGAFGARQFNLYPLVKAFSSSSRVKFGWPELQAVTLKECLDVARILGDLPNAVIYAARLLRRLHQHLPGQEQADIAETMRKLVVRRKGAVDHEDSNDVVPIVRSVLGGLCGVPVVRSIDAVRVSERFRTREHVVSGGEDNTKERDPFIFNPYLNKGAGGAPSGSRSGLAGKEGELTLVAGEAAYWDVVLANPFGFELDVQSAVIAADVQLESDVDGDEGPTESSSNNLSDENPITVSKLGNASLGLQLFSPISLSFTIPARHRNFQIRLSAIAHIPCKLLVRGVSFKVLGGSLLEDIIPVPPKLTGENGGPPIVNGKKVVFSGEDKERFPLMQACGVGLAGGRSDVNGFPVGLQTAVMLFEGEQNTLAISIENIGATPVNYLTVHFVEDCDPTLSPFAQFQQQQQSLNPVREDGAPDDIREPPEDIYERDVFEKSCRGIWCEEEVQNSQVATIGGPQDTGMSPYSTGGIPPGALWKVGQTAQRWAVKLDQPIRVGARKTVKCGVWGKVGWKSVLAVFEYGYLPEYTMDGNLPARFFTRRLTVPILITVNRALDIANVDVFPFASMATSGNTSQRLEGGVSAEGSMKDLVVNGKGHADGGVASANGTGIYHRDSPLGTLEDSVAGYSGDISDFVNRDFCLFTFDLRNKWNSTFEVTFEVGDEKREGAGSVWKVQVNIEGGGSRRIVLPMRRKTLPTSLTYLPIPYPPTQFVLSKLLKYSPEGELLHRALFWTREDLVGGIERPGRISALWRAGGGRRGGLVAALRGFRLSSDNLVTLTDETIGFDVTVRLTAAKLKSALEERVKCVGPSRFEVPRNVFVEVNWAVRNRRDTPIRMCMRVVPIQDADNGNVEYGESLKESVVWAGNLDSVLGPLQPGESASFRLIASFLSTGQYKLLYHCQEINTRAPPPVEAPVSKSKPKEIDLASLGRSAVGVAGDGIYWGPEPVLIDVVV